MVGLQIFYDGDMNVTERLRAEESSLVGSLVLSNNAEKWLCCIVV